MSMLGGTPPHVWALALYRCRDYERVGVPMLPVVAGPDAFAPNDVGLDVAVLGERVLVLDPKARAVRVFAPAKVVHVNE